MSGGNGENVGEVVEAAVGRVVAGKQRLHVQIQREQIADGVVVFGAIQALHRADAAGIGMGGPGLVELRFQERSPRRDMWPDRAASFPGGRHRTRAQFHDHLLDGLGVRARLGQIQSVESEAGGSGAS